MNTSLPDLAALHSLCYQKGVSLYHMKDDKIVERSPKLLQRLCSSADQVGDPNSRNFRVPPRPERALAIERAMKVPLKNAWSESVDPFASFDRLIYMRMDPVRGDSKTFPKNHDVYKISPHFPPPNNGWSAVVQPPRPKKTPKPKPKPAKKVQGYKKHKRRLPPQKLV